LELVSRNFTVGLAETVLESEHFLLALSVVVFLTGGLVGSRFEILDVFVDVVL
jgi:hypothetical protein